MKANRLAHRLGMAKESTKGIAVVPCRSPNCPRCAWDNFIHEVGLALGLYKILDCIENWLENRTPKERWLLKVFVMQVIVLLFVLLSR